MEWKAEPIVHRGKARIALTFEYSREINERVRKLAGAQWSNSLKLWHLPDNEAYRKRFQLSPKEPSYMTTAPDEAIQKKLKAVADKIKLKGYSGNTGKNYGNHLKEYFMIVSKKYKPDEVTKDIIEKYLLWRLEKKKPSESDMNSHINAIKFYYEQVLGRQRMLFDLPRPQKPHTLPAVWAKTDIIKMVKALSNLKHQTMLLMAYAHGMRVSEIATLKLADMDSKRMQIHIKAGKGKKDRVVNLSETVLEVLKSYYKQYKPSVFLFENDLTHEPISIRTIQEVFQQAKGKAGLNKKAGMHSLRHSYATHLHEQGVDIKFLKELLGHNSIRTTEIYTHVSKKDISKIPSPLDNLKF